MSFYASIAPWYDTIFPVDLETADVIALGVPAGGAALDLACGTGGYALELARRGFSVTGIDLDPGMIERAVAASGGAGPEFRVLDMRTAPRAFSGRRYDLIFCIGNSLVHLPDREEIAALLCGLRELAAPGARLVLQILNYDRILDRQVRELPPIDRPGLAFRRAYHPDGERLRFATELSTGDGRILRNEVKLFPLRAQPLALALTGAPFRAVSLFGDFDLSPLTPDSPCVVAVAFA